MTDEQATALMRFLTKGFASEAWDTDLVDNWDIYERMCYRIDKDGSAGLKAYLDEQVDQEKPYDDIGIRLGIYTKIKNILYGDISLVPPLMEQFPGLCKWRLSLEESP